MITIESLQADLKAANEKLDAALKSNDELKQENEALVKNNDELIKQVEDLSAKVAAEPTATTKTIDETFTFKKKTYGFNFKEMHHKNSLINIDTVIGDEKLQEELVNMGSGMIYEK